MKSLRFVYRNHKNEISERTIQPDTRPGFGLEWYAPGRNPEYHPDGGWMISGFDEARKGARRTFELKRIIGPITEVD